MSVYVDDMRFRARVAGCSRPARWSHLMADTHDELEDFARRLGLSPRWLQYPGKAREHYDVTDTVRKKAIEYGAKPITYGGTEQRALLTRKRIALGSAA